MEFVQNNAGERIIGYYDKLYNKAEDLGKRNNRLSLYMIILGAGYFLITKSTFSTLQLGPLSVNDFTLFTKLTPPLFSYFLLEFAVVNSHRAELLKTLKWLNLSIYKHDITVRDLDDSYYNFFTRLSLPFSIWQDLMKVNDKKETLGWGGVVIFLPLIGIVLLPFYFEFIAIRAVITNFWGDWTGKASVIVSVWLMLATLYFYLKLLPQALETALKDKSS